MQYANSNQIYLFFANYTGTGYCSKTRFIFYTAPPPLKHKFWKEKSFHTISRPKVLLVIRSFYMRKTSYGTSKKCFPELIMVVSILIWSLKRPFVHHANLHCKISLLQQPR